MVLSLVVVGDEEAARGVVGVEQWAELRREHFVGGVSIKEMARRDGAVAQHDPAGAAQRDAAGLSAGADGVEAGSVQGRDPPAAARGSEAAGRAGPRADRAAGLSTAGKTIVDDYLREVRPLFAPPPRTFQRTVYRPGEICQFDVWQPRAEVPVGHGQTRRGWVVVACLGYSRAGAGRAGVLASRRADLLAGIARLPVAAGRAAADVGLGSPGRHPRPRRAPDGGVRRVLRAAEGRLALLRAGRSAGQGRRRAAAGLRGDQLRAGPACSPTSSTSRTSSTPGLRRSTRARTRRCAAARSTGSPTSAR